MQIPEVKQITADEMWYAGERRHSPVSESDPEVQKKVCKVILEFGQIMREKAETTIALSN